MNKELRIKDIQIPDNFIAYIRATMMQPSDNVSDKRLRNHFIKWYKKTSSLSPEKIRVFFNGWKPEYLDEFHTFGAVPIKSLYVTRRRCRCRCR